MPAATQNPLTARLNAEARATRRILGILGPLDRASRGRVLRTVFELNEETHRSTLGPNGPATYAGGGAMSEG